jgi:uncharacterized membrane-anchored protein
MSYSFPPKNIELWLGVGLLLISIVMLYVSGPNYGKNVFTADAFGFGTIILLLSPILIVHALVRYGLDARK